MATSFLDNKLVELVRANPSLYGGNLRAAPYESTKRKADVWNSIAASLGVDAKHCLIRWKYLSERFRRELQVSRKSKSNPSMSTKWPLFEKMKFLDRSVKYQGYRSQNGKKKALQQSVGGCSAMDAEHQVEGVSTEDDDDPLQEAMDDQQTISFVEAETDSATIASPQPESPISSEVNWKRIQALLESLDPSNRGKAEKRIVAYLCHCQLRTLNNNDVEDLTV